MTETRTPNIPALRKYVEWVEEQEALPEIDRTWYQRYWHTEPSLVALCLLEGENGEVGISLPYLNQVAAHCGTAYCLAGKIAMDADKRYATELRVDDVHVAEKALEVLGLKSSEFGWYHAIFKGNNTAADIRRIAEAEAGERL